MRHIKHQTTTSMTGTRCPTHHDGADLHCHKTKSTHTTADANLAAIIRRCMTSRVMEGEAEEEWNETITATKHT